MNRKNKKVKKSKKTKVKKRPTIVINKVKQSAELESLLNNDYTLSRFAALVEAVNLIYEHSRERNTAFDDVDLKPLAIQKYIDSKSDEIMQRLTVQNEKASIGAY